MYPFGDTFLIPKSKKCPLVNGRDHVNQFGRVERLSVDFVGPDTLEPHRDVVAEESLDLNMVIHAILLLHLEVNECLLDILEHFVD